MNTINTPEQTGLSAGPKLSLDILPSIIPPQLVEEVLARHNKKEKRFRVLPAPIVVYYVICMVFFYANFYREVWRKMTENFQGVTVKLAFKLTVPAKSAISQARARLGAEPFLDLFRTICRPLGTPESRGV